jgi:death-on-curing protein
MDEISVEKIIEIHDEVIANYDGAGGILTESTLHFLVYRINRERDLFRRAAIAMHAIGSQHPFIDGNKRTALIVAENILGRDGYYLALEEDRIVGFILGVASYRYQPDAIERWMRENAEKV